MNKRIEELSKLATESAISLNPEEDSYGRPVNPAKFQQDRDTEFAKLIVRECAKYPDSCLDTLFNNILELNNGHN